MQAMKVDLSAAGQLPSPVARFGIDGFIFVLAAAGFALVPLLLARLWALKYSPNKPGQQKNATYECGLEARGGAAGDGSAAGGGSAGVSLAVKSGTMGCGSTMSAKPSQSRSSSCAVRTAPS